ncbi:MULTISPECIES: hypothetical protein [Thalassomonas]|uniref:Uncharacterized protein n=1 Tax=Thalassomonas actiniarum TaxID=485447 RepID=A0AAE9YP24_9GAMM|nr:MULTISPECIES: hypothetical protein [Thalassomonas]WDD98146.1 hypothetical protein SG35_023150 [Thalassomonas actiniarum]
MIIEQFINEKTTQISAYVKAVLEQGIHYTELDKFIVDVMDEWTLLNVTEETPGNAQERVFWHIVHEISLHGAQSLSHDLYLKSEINTCLDFFAGTGSYPIDCIGWRPIP